MNSPRDISLGEAFKRGFGLARRSPGVVGLAFLSDVAAVLLSTGAALSIAAVTLAAAGRSIDPLLIQFAPEAGLAASLGAALSAPGLLPALGAAVVAWLVSLAIRLVWLTSAAETFARELEEEPRPGFLAAAAAGAPRAIPAAAVAVPLYLASFLYQAAALGSAAMAWVHALATQQRGLAASAALALAIGLSMLLPLITDALASLTVIRAVGARIGPLHALAGAARLFWSRLPALALLAFLFGAMFVIADFVGGSGGALIVGGGAAAVALMLSARLATGMIGSLISAYVRTAEVGALCALDAGARGVLPEPPVPVPPPLPPQPAVLEAVPILETQAVLPTEPKA